MKKVDHIPHIEDLFLTKDALVGKNLLSNILYAMATKNSKGLSLKYDGSPSLLAGRDPRDGEFFVATKSIFNVTPVVYKSIDEIAKIENDGLRRVMEVAFVNLGTYHFEQIIQGDVIWASQEDLFCVGDDVYAKTNILNYYVGGLEKVAGTNLGIAWHTGYTGTIDALQMTPNTLRLPYRTWSNSTVPLYHHLSVDLDFTKLARTSYKDLMLQLQSIDALPLNVPEKLFPILRTFFANNFGLRTANWLTEALHLAISREQGKDESKLKTMAGKDRCRSRYVPLHEWVELNRDNLWDTFADYRKVVKLKYEIMDELEGTTDVCAYDDEYLRARQEGFVYKAGEWIVKLVDRDTFTVANLNSPYR